MDGLEAFQGILLLCSKIPFSIIAYIYANISAPFQVTYTSDYFQELYDLAVELIRNGRAYVDHQVDTQSACCCDMNGMHYADPFL